MPISSKAAFQSWMPSLTQRRYLIGVVCSTYHTIGCAGGDSESDGSAFTTCQRLM